MNRIREFIEDYMHQIILGMVGVIIVFIVIICGLLIHNNRQVNAQPDVVTTSSSHRMRQEEHSSTASSGIQQAAKSVKNTQIYVDVKGAVKNPGVYQVNGNMRVQDAINLAGGFNHSADKKQINLAQRMADQQVVYVPIRGEIKGNAVASGITPQSPDDNSANDAANSESSTEEQGKVNLNSADATKLQELNGIGEKKAATIITYRKEHGKFKEIADLKDVPGFGDKTFANLKSSICV